jgi:hypothetical protein
MDQLYFMQTGEDEYMDEDDAYSEFVKRTRRAAKKKK